MSKIKIFVIAAVMVLTASLVARAEEVKALEVTKDHGVASGHEHGMMKVKSGEGMADCPLQAKMMHGAFAPMMVATSDGGVVVMAGGKLIKYDRNLTVVKEVSLPSCKCCGSGAPMGEKKKIMMKTRDLNEAGKTAPAPVKK